MNKPSQAIEIFLQPGDLYFGDRDNRIRTVLGSCVSLTFWHPKLLVGGMCHYMLPNRSLERRTASDLPLDGRYADEAIELLTKEINLAGVPHREYEVKLFETRLQLRGGTSWRRRASQYHLRCMERECVGQTCRDRAAGSASAKAGK